VLIFRAKRGNGRGNIFEKGWGSKRKGAPVGGREGKGFMLACHTNFLLVPLRRWVN